MKKTEALEVVCSVDIQKDHLILHPNDGFDLGLMRVSHPATLCTKIPLNDFLKGAEGEDIGVEVELWNNCPPKTLQLNQTQWKFLGMPPKAVILYDGSRLFIHPLQS